ncbi:hypothetical protein CC85DRAFT_285822 [Cutaneotrichosporon oleaginosum]|uniref:Uncharacterized protein n=1 Tax=Cutaneotrichosporon oleaginosum TaxID=879819 RepID=A0A0J0XLW2_9TREE|nr:uncharacterized protein CC85DRAFT_285822 [Cutaneotrichosporon oleaginosum]KLT42058.1 hypothetical protein CC85DRAFT_285822 [Cutaneotrichosporon oleaginosum]TXT04703.1 hypothetical protein COLE_07522 [Cutaneotrichosporon oleaginosum]
MVDRVPLTLLPESSDPRKRRLKSLDDIVAEGWSMTSPSNSVSTDPRSTHSMSQSGSSSEVELGITAKRRLANSNPPGYNMIPAIPSRLLAEHARQRRAEAQSAQSIEMTSSSNLNVSTLAEMLQKSLTISEPEDGHTFQSNSSELEFDLDFELDGDTMWSDEGVIGDGSFRDYRGHQCTLVCQRLLEPSGSKARCTASANSEPGDQNEMGDAHSSHILDIDRAFRRSRSFTLAPQGYVHVDDAARISDQSSSNFSTASSSDSWCVSGPRADGGGGGSDHNHHEGSINRLIGPGWSPHASPGSCSSSPRWAPDPYECGLPLATITEASEEDSPTPQTRFWSTREYLSSVASAHKDQR